MRQLKLLCTFLLISALLLCGLIACGGDPESTTTGTTLPPGAIPAGAAISDIGSYKLYYPSGIESEKFEAVRTFVTKSTEAGQSFIFREDLAAQVPVGTLEILIGDTNRPESAGVRLGLYDYAIYFENNRLCINGGSAEALAMAVDLYFEHYVVGGVFHYPTSQLICRADYPYDSISLAGSDIWEYSIVYDAEQKALATVLQEAIAEACGARLPLLSARSTPSAKEIIVGNLSSGERQTPTAAAGECRIEKVGTRIYLYGFGEGGAYSAAMKFLELIGGEGTALPLAFDTPTVAALLPTMNPENNMPEFADFRGEYSLEMSAENVFERFKLAKAELPDEMTVYQPLDVSNFPLSQKNALYVSTRGSDKAAGTKEAPLATLGKAIEKMNGRGGGVIYMMGGTYSLDETIKLTATVGGSPSAPLFIKAYEDADVTLTSNKLFDNYDSGAWSLVDFDSDRLAARMPEAAKSSGLIYSATLEDLGLTAADMAEIDRSSGAPKLYVGDDNYTLARFPNESGDSRNDFYFTHAYDTGTVTSKTSGFYSDWVRRCGINGWSLNTVVGWQIRVINQKDNGEMKNAAGEMNAQALADEITSWVNTGNIWIYGSTYQGWETGYYNLAFETEGMENWHYAEDGETMLLGGFYEDSKGIATTVYDEEGNATIQNGYYYLKSIHPNSAGCGPSQNSAAGRNTFYLFNAIEALDIPGEWFYDQKSGTVYLYATEAFLAGEDITYSGNDAFPLLYAANVTGLVFDGIDINGSGEFGMRFSSCDSVVIQNSKMKNTTASAVYMMSSTNFRLLNSEFSRCYTMPMVQLGNSSTTEDTNHALQVTNNCVQNCVFYDPIINLDVALFHGGSRMVISHNYFKNTVVKSGFSSEVIIEYNTFEGGSATMTDGGMMYFSTLGARGAHCRYNVCHMFKGSHRAVYFDTQTSGCYAYGNIISTLEGITKTAYNAWYSSTGNGNVCYGNIFLLRNPNQRTEAGIAGGDEPGTTTPQSQGDNLLQSALFYYYWSDDGYTMATSGNPLHYNFSYKEMREYSDAHGVDLFSASEETIKAALGTAGRMDFRQNEAGGWWLGHAEEEVQRYLKTFSVTEWEKRFPGYINSLESMKLILEAYDNTNYHVRYFYFPNELSGESYTFKTKEGALFTIPTYQYKDGTGTVTVPQSTREATQNGDGEWTVTLTFEEIAAIERMERAPCNAVIKDNVILGGTPKNTGGNQVFGNEVDESKTIVAATMSGFDPAGSALQEGNFLYFTYADIIPEADNHDYTIDDNTWDYIENDLGMGEGFRDIFALVDQDKCGVTIQGFDKTKYE